MKYDLKLHCRRFLTLILLVQPHNIPQVSVWAWPYEAWVLSIHSTHDTRIGQ